MYANFECVVKCFNLIWIPIMSTTFLGMIIQGVNFDQSFPLTEARPIGVHDSIFYI